MMLGEVVRVSWAILKMFWEILTMLKRWGLMIETKTHRGTLLALVESEQPDHTDREQGILPTLLTVDEQGRQDEVMDQED